MGLLVQLKLLLWKNLVLRKRQKFRCIVELVWPLCLFILLMVLRSKGLFQRIHQCHFEEKPLPSSGQVLFWQGVICGFNNTCHQWSSHADRNYSSAYYSDLTLLLNDTRAFTQKKMNSNRKDIEKLLKYVNQMTNELENGSHKMPEGSRKTNVSKQTSDDDKLKTVNGKLEEIIDKLKPTVEILNILERIDDNSDNLTQILNENPAIDDIFIRLHNFICGNQSRTTLRTMLYKEQPKNNMQNYLEKLRDMDTTIEYTEDPEASPECNRIYRKLTTTPSLKFVWRYLEPFVRGKVVFSPNTTVVTRLMARVQESLATPMMNDFEDEKVDLSLDEILFNETISKVQRLQKMYSNISTAKSKKIEASLVRAEKVVKDYYKAVLGMNKQNLAINNSKSNLTEALKCYSSISFEGYATEKEAENRSMALSEKNQLLALIVFYNDLDDQLNPLVTYKIRMNSERLPDPLDTKTFLRGPNYKPFEDLKLITYGFVYIQDLIERSIIYEHTGRRDTPGIILKQFPHPCFTEDWFMQSVGDMFPLFMVISWVYTASMIVKSIVHEKEQKLRETMKILGVNNSVLWYSWFLDSIIPMTVVVLILSTILVYGGILARAEYSLVVCFLECYAVATISLCFLMSAFFSNANLAASAGGIIFFISYLPFPFFESWYSHFPFEVKFFGCLLSNVALGLGTKYFEIMEIEGSGSHWSNLRQSPIEGDNFSVFAVMIALIVDACVYFVITCYIENVFPGSHGIPKPWNYPFTRAHWCPKRWTSAEIRLSDAEASARKSGDAVVESEPTHLEVGVSIQNLSKTYKSGKSALNNLSLNFYQDQITAFLGRNGAGKTTTISIITGLFPPTSGSAKIYGLDVFTQMSLIRKSLGVCQQYNILFGNLTVQEHLWFFGRMKEKSPGEIQVEIQQILADLGLLQKRFRRAENLSGGMKRKLCIAIAFIGGSRTVVLDEPTAGVDPYSRIGIWNLITKYKKGRTIILTTHNMTEAELLGDRIAICDSGRLLCCGSGAFLKSEFGWGYILTVDCKEEVMEQKEKLSQGIHNIMPEAKEIERYGTEVKYSLPKISGNILLYEALFDFLEISKISLGVTSFGLADTTLEDIFLRLINDNEPSSELRESDPDPEIDFNVKTSYDDLTLWQKVNHEYYMSPACRQFRALFQKRCIRCKRGKLELLFQLVLPALLVCFCMSITQNLTRTEPPLVHPIDIDVCNSCESFFNVLPSKTVWSVDYARQLTTNAGAGTTCVKRKNLRDKRCIKPNVTETQESHDPALFSNCSCETGHNICQPSNETVYIPETIMTASMQPFLNTTGKNITDWLLTTGSVDNRLRTGGFTFGVNLPMKGRSLSTNEALPNSTDFKKNRSYYHETDISDNILVWFNNKWSLSPVVYLNSVNNMILRASMNNSESYGIRLLAQGMNLTVGQHHIEVLKRATSALILTMSLIFSLSFVPASFVVYLIEERRSDSKHLQFLSGLNWAVYWLQTFIWDLVCHSIASGLCVLVVVMFQEEAYLGRQSLPCLTLLFILYGWACIPLMYAVSFYFDVPSSAFVALSSLNILLGVMSTATTYVLKIFNEQHLKDIEVVLSDFLLIFPHFSLGDGLMKITEIYFISTSLSVYDVTIDLNLSSWKFLGRNFMSLFIEGVVFFIVVILFERFHNQGLCSEQIVSMDPPTQLEEDVEAERKRILNTYVDDVLVLKCLTKIYKSSNSIAVNQLCLGVDRGQCFGLLGLNGAGKTSTFKMLTGDTRITFGDATVTGFSVRDHLNSVRSLIGYCPQFDALDAKLTPTEHLTLYATLRNIPYENSAEAVEACLKNFDLWRYKDVCAKYLSGGNKRKLSTAIAILGNPQLIFLDEPTSGMDPKARRFLWSKIKQCVLQGRAVVLTSHSMSECEALCSRLTIMVNGQFMCLGSTQHLKDKFAKGYNLILRTPAEKMPELKSMILSEIPLATEGSSHYAQIKFNLNVELSNLSSVLRVLENAREENLLYDYSLSQKSLVEVFLHFVSQQKSPKEYNRPNLFNCCRGDKDSEKIKKKESC